LRKPGGAHLFLAPPLFAAVMAIPLVVGLAFDAPETVLSNAFMLSLRSGFVLCALAAPR